MRILTAQPRVAREMVSGTMVIALPGEATADVLVAGLGPCASELFYGISQRDAEILVTVGTFC